MRPVGADEGILSLWDKTKPTKLELLLKGWQKYNLNTPLPSLEESPFQEWKENGCNYQGQRKTNGHKHGVVRETRPGSYVWEGTYKDN